MGLKSFWGPGAEERGSSRTWPVPRPWLPELRRFQALDVAILPTRRPRIGPGRTTSLIRFTEIQLRVRVVLALQGRQRYFQEAHRFRKGHSILKQGDCQTCEIATVRDRRRNGSAARDDLEVGELDFQRHRSPPTAD